MKIIYFFVIIFILSACSSAKKTNTINLSDSNTKVAAIKAIPTDSTKSNLKNQKDSTQNSDVIKAVKSEVGRINSLLTKKLF